MQRWVLVIVGLSTLVLGCQTGPVEISTGILAGQIGGVDWTIGTAETTPSLSDGPDSFFAVAYAETFTPCSGESSAAVGDRLILTIPRTPGDYTLSGSLKQTLVVQSTQVNYLAKQGRMVIDEITAITIRGGTHFQSDGANQVDGQFEITVCPGP
jgi:hypothetical protein